MTVELKHHKLCRFTLILFKRRLIRSVRSRSSLPQIILLSSVIDLFLWVTCLSYLFFTCAYSEYLHVVMCIWQQIPEVAATCNLTAIMDGYYKILFPLNPGSIRPVMPSGCEHEVLLRPHNRESLPSVDRNTPVYIS